MVDQRTQSYPKHPPLQVIMILITIDVTIIIILLNACHPCPWYLAVLRILHRKAHKHDQMSYVSALEWPEESESWILLEMDQGPQKQQVQLYFDASVVYYKCKYNYLWGTYQHSTQDNRYYLFIAC